VTDDQEQPTEPAPEAPQLSPTPEPQATEQTPLILGPQIAARSAIPGDLKDRIEAIEKRGE